MFGHISPMMSKTSTMEITNKQKEHTDNHTIVYLSLYSTRKQEWQRDNSV